MMTNPLATIRTAARDNFVYVPPALAFDAVRVAVKVDLGRLGQTVRPEVLVTVLRGLRRANPGGRILVLDGSETMTEMREHYAALGLDRLNDPNLRLADAEEFPLWEYPNRLEPPVRYPVMVAPSAIGEYECCIVVSALHSEPYPAGAIASLRTAFPRDRYAGSDPVTRGALTGPESLKDVYFCLGHHVDGAVVESGTHITWGDDLLSVDRTACRAAGLNEPDYLREIADLEAAS